MDYNDTKQKNSNDLIFNIYRNKDLEYLRIAAARELLGAVYHYFKASQEVLNEPFEDGMTYQEYFAHEATDEMVHYLDEIRKIAELDPVQREELIDHGLGPYLVGDEYPPITFWYGPYEYPESERESRWLKTIDHVIKSIDFELETINIYENFIKKSNDRDVKRIFIDAMNHEKGDIADFNQMLFGLLYTDNPDYPQE